MKHEVVITGLGLLSPLGATEQDFAASLIEGRDAFETESVREGWDLSIARIRDFVFRDWVTTRNKRTKKMDVVSQYASTAALLALRSAGFIDEQGPLALKWRPDFGICTATTLGALESIATFHEQLALEGPDRVDPKVFPNTSHNVPCAHVTIEFGLEGPMLNLCTGSHGGTAALATAWRMLAQGRARRLLVGAFDHLGPAFLRGLPSWDGPLGEGAAFLVLETAEAAKERGAEARARLLGAALGTWSSETSPSWKACLDGLLSRNDLTWDDLAWIIEGRAMDLGGAVPSFPLKGRTGECLASFGAFAAATAVLQVEGRFDKLKDFEAPRSSGVVLVSDPGLGGSGAALLLA